jgi:vacuolar-type H+-ATPase subunit H
MTEEQLQEERRYRFEERLGIMTDGKREPTPEEITAAERDADEDIENLRRET